MSGLTPPSVLSGLPGPPASSVSSRSTPSEADLAQLCDALDAVSIARPAAIQVLSVIDDPNADAPKVAAAVEGDPAFATQVMRLANSAFYGMSGRVSNTGFAVTVIGFSAIRSLAAVTATGLDRADRPKPDGFWFHAAATAAGCSVVAPRFGLAKGDAFAAGLLHDLGIALLHGYDTTAHQGLLALHGADGVALDAAELEAFGMGHSAAAARVLSAWRFPKTFVEAVAVHHGDPSSSDDGPIAQAVRVGDLLADAAGRVLAHRLQLVATKNAAAVAGLAPPPDEPDDDIDDTPMPPPLDDDLRIALSESLRIDDIGVLESMVDSTVLRSAEIMASLPIG